MWTLDQPLPVSLAPGSQPLSTVSMSLTSFSFQIPLINVTRGVFNFYFPIICANI